MIESALARKNLSFKLKLTVKGLVSLGIVALAVILPQIVHLVAGASGGVQWLPMYLPVLLGGCLLGMWFGLGIGVLAPLVSFAITSAFGSPMPVAERLPFMMVELGIYGGLSGIFSTKIVHNGWMAFPAVLLASVCGRGVFLLLVVIFQSVISLTPALVWQQIQTGLLALVLQAVIVPFIVMGLRRLLLRNNN